MPYLAALQKLILEGHLVDVVLFAPRRLRSCALPWRPGSSKLFGAAYPLCRLLKVLFVLKLKFVLLGKMPLSIRLFVLMVRPAVAVRPEGEVRCPRQAVALLVSRPGLD